MDRVFWCSLQKYTSTKFQQMALHGIYRVMFRSNSSEFRNKQIAGAGYRSRTRLVCDRPLTPISLTLHRRAILPALPNNPHGKNNQLQILHSSYLISPQTNCFNNSIAFIQPHKQND